MDNTFSPDEYTRAVAALLRDAKGQSGKSFDALALETGLGRATVVRYIKGERDIPVPAAVRIARALGVNPGELLDQAAANVHGA